MGEESEKCTIEVHCSSRPDVPWVATGWRLVRIVQVAVGEWRIFVERES